MTRRTKFVATIGPASDTPHVLRQLIVAGVDVVRLNLSHGTLDEHLERMDRVRAAARDVGRFVAVLADLPGPKIRSGPMPEHGLAFEPGSSVRLVPGGGPCSDGLLTVDYPALLDDLRAGSRIRLGDGAISMLVDDVAADAATAQVETGGHCNGRPGVHLPSERLRLRTPTADDLVLAEAMAAAGADFMAVSFVREPNDMCEVRDVVGDRARLVAKIETSAAIASLDGIVAASDAVMVARGDLGIDCPIEDVPHLQKTIIRHCVEVGVPVITATQMLESMISAPSPTRAEVSDVANAVFDGTDALMLSGETAIGRDPVGVVEVMSTVSTRAESEASYRRWARHLSRVQRGPGWLDAPDNDAITAAITHAASEAASDVDARAILCCTRSGRTANAMARFRPESQLLGLAPDARTARALALTWGVTPLHVDTYGSTDEMVGFAIERSLESGAIDHGDTVLVLAGAPDLRPGADRADPTLPATDVLRILRVG
ncbi:MAG: pyruvate kinase [Acidimicrobiia bacterium]|nr:pyruvate kinase [Acidimicrobiia bacterium]